MEKITTVLPFRQVDSVDNPLTERARDGARRMLAIAIGAEIDTFVAAFCTPVASGRPTAGRATRSHARAIDPDGIGPI